MRYLPPFAFAMLAACCAPGWAAAPACEPRDLGFDRVEAGWKPQPISKLKRDTAYTLAKEDGRTVLRASADNRDKAREDAPLRLVVAFDGDKDSLPAEERRRYAAARKLTGANLPYAVLMYIWSDHVPVGTVIASAHTSQVKMIAVASGGNGLGSWQSVRRNLAEDYRRAWGAVPGPLLGVGVMTDTDNTGEKATGLYADIRLECAGR